MVKKNKMAMVPLEGKRRWCRGTPERQRRRTSGEQCWKYKDAGEVEMHCFDLCVERKGRRCVWEERGKLRDG